MTVQGVRTGRRHTAGTVSIAKGSAVLRGEGTNWHSIATRGLPEMPLAGRIAIEGGDEIYEVHMINSDALITLRRPFAREDVSGATYMYFDEKIESDTRSVPEAASARSVASATKSPKPGVSTPESGGSLKELASSGTGEIVRTVIYALLIALVIRVFLFQPFNIPSGSMMPTLLVGDYIFVSKYRYGYSRHSMPFSPPVFAGRLLGQQPKRGDVIVFKLPSDGRTDYIKRLIGLPGDRIQMIDGVLNINGEPVPRVRVDDFVSRDRAGNVSRVPQYRETMPDGLTYLTLDSNRNGEYDNTGVFVVPEGSFFMMGDNRDNSLDSRVPPNEQYPRQGGVGYVPFENFVGRAEIIFFSTDGSAHFWEFWRWPQATRFGRLFHGIPSE